MKLEVITGYREYLLPNPVDRDGLIAALRAVAPRPTIPLVRWAGDPTWYHGFLFDDEAAVARRIALFLEYVADAVGADETAFVLLPLEWWSDPASRGATLAHPRVRLFVDAAEAALGAARVRCRRLTLSDNTQAVLDRLRAETGAAPAGPRSAAIPTTAVEGPVFGTALEAMRRNYGLAVIRLAEQILRRRGVLGEAPLAPIAEPPPLEHVLIRTELTPERILAELEPGGALRELLTR